MKEDGTVYYMAQALCDTVLGEGTYDVLKPLSEKMNRKSMSHYLAMLQQSVKNSIRKHSTHVCDNYVTLTDGTGVKKDIAPAFGEDDSKVGRKYDLPFVQLVDGKGEMTKETPWAGMFCKKADPRFWCIKRKWTSVPAPVFEHSYPHQLALRYTTYLLCTRESWFIKMTAVGDDLIRNNNTINWIPESIGKGRFGDCLENVQDWGVSRNRYWGTPLNIWECECAASTRSKPGRIKI